jgi:hypothetical protein
LVSLVGDPSRPVRARGVTVTHVSFSYAELISLAATLLALAATYWRIRERLTAVETKVDAVRRELSVVSGRVNGHIDGHAKGHF